MTTDPEEGERQVGAHLNGINHEATRSAIRLRDKRITELEIALSAIATEMQAQPPSAELVQDILRRAGFAR